MAKKLTDKEKADKFLRKLLTDCANEYQQEHNTKEIPIDDVFAYIDSHADVKQKITKLLLGLGGKDGLSK